MTKAIRDNKIQTNKLITLRNEIDKIADRNPDMSFISFADSLIIKHNWNALLTPDNTQRYQPEKLLLTIRDLKRCIKTYYH